VRPNRIRKSLGGERTYAQDISSGAGLNEALDEIIDIVWTRIAEAEACGRTVTLKLKFSDFRIITRAKSQVRPVADKAEFARIAREILAEILPLPMPVRLMGLTLSGLEREAEERAEARDVQLQLF